MLSARESLQRLIEGNRRFVAGMWEAAGKVAEKRRELVAGQAPFAIILGCSDSRVPAELVFDQGLGDLFVIRVAGNIVAPSQIGSIEFAAGQFGSALEELERPRENRSPNLRSIVDRIRPAVEPLLESPGTQDADGLRARAVRANIRASARQLRAGSRILEELVAAGKLLIVGAEYSLESGKVDFFEGMPGDL